MEKIQHQGNAKSLESKEKSLKEGVTKTVKFSKKVREHDWKVTGFGNQEVTADLIIYITQRGQVRSWG